MTLNPKQLLFPALIILLGSVFLNPEQFIALCGLTTTAILLAWGGG